MWYENGQKDYEGLFKNVNGFETYWYDGKESGKMEWKDYEMWDGKFITRYEKGYKKSEGLLDDGNGLSTWWYENGNRMFEKKYRNSKIFNYLKFYENGMKEIEIN